MAKYTKKEVLELYNLELVELMGLARRNTFEDVEFCSLISAKTGACSQNCAYCAQSRYHSAKIENHPLISVEAVKDAAIESKRNLASRFAIVTSGKSPDDRDIDELVEMIAAINSVEGLSSCASLGMIDEAQAKRLCNAGLTRYHHNINTCKSYYGSICTTHSYEDRLSTIQAVRAAGMELCCGVILGMGESKEQRVEMAMELSEIQPDSIPVNFLTPIKGTPFENYLDKIDEEEILRTLAVFKLVVPKARIRFAGGRALRLSKHNREYALENCVDAILIGNYLTTVGIPPSQDIESVKNVGKTVLCTIT